MNHYYIKKRGLFYRPNSCGYTERRMWAGTYTEEEIKSHKGCDELTFQLIDVKEHNELLQAEIDEIQKNKIS